MAGVNKVMLVGHLGKDPEIRTLENGTKVASFSLATTESYRNKENQRVEQTEWHNIVLWRSLAEISEKYLKKGNLVFIEGSIRTRSYEKDGQKRFITEIVANDMTMLGSKKESGNGSENTVITPDTTDIEQAGPENDLPF